MRMKGTGRIVAAGIAVAVMLASGGCRAKKDALAVLGPEEFFRSGLAALSGSVPDSGRRSVSEWQHRHTGILFVFKDNIITGESETRFMGVDFTDSSFRDWLRLSSPRIVMVKGNGLPDIEVYLEPGKTLHLIPDSSSAGFTFSGDLGRVNTEIQEAPSIAGLEEIDRRIASDSAFSPAMAYEMYEAADSVWRIGLLEYLSRNNISETGRHVLSNAPVFRKAYWLMANEEFLSPRTADDYSALRDALLVDDPYLMAQKWPGGLVRTLASSALLKRLGEGERGDGKTADYKEAVMRYMRRYDEMGKMLGVSGMPRLAQLAVARTLCVGGVLKRSEHLQAALAIVDAVASSYIPDEEIRSEVERYARRLFKADRYVVKDTPEGKMLKGILAPYAGKRVVLDFWTYSCRPCLNSMRDTREIRERHRGNPDWTIVYVTGANVTDENQYREVAEKYLAGDETVFLDSDSYKRLTAMFDVQEVPWMVLFDRDGSVLDEHYRPEPGFADLIEGRLPSEVR